MKFLVIAFAFLALAQAQRTQYFVYTRQNPINSTEVNFGSISNSNLSPSRPTKFILHGFTDNSNTQWVIDTKDAYLTREDVNVIAVDWAGAVNDDQRAGTETARFYDEMIALGYDAGTFHCIGHSQGGHVCGFSGKRISRGTLNRISGLDIALASKYMYNDSNSRLDAADATTVDCLHTDGGGNGMMGAVCDFDFYPNGGTRNQPGCGVIEVNGICSHRRCQELYIESINTDQFISTACDSWDNFINGLCNGNPTVSYGATFMNPSAASGTYAFNTRRNPPYACGNC